MLLLLTKFSLLADFVTCSTSNTHVLLGSLHTRIMLTTRHVWLL
jgi:hypothetical protein